ncbi:hypothetical protein ACFLRT_03240, partial [Acidobacteriota bacterium]
GDRLTKDRIRERAVKYFSELFDSGSLEWYERRHGVVLNSHQLFDPAISEFAKWAKKMDDIHFSNDILKRGIKTVVQKAETYMKEDDVGSSSREYGTAAKWAEQLGDEGLKRQLNEKLVDLNMKHAKEIEERNIKKAINYYANAAKFVEKLGIEKLRTELYEKVINLLLENPGSMEDGVFQEPGTNYVRVAKWAEQINNMELRNEFYKKAFKLHLENSGTIYAPQFFFDSIEWAEKINNKELRTEFLKKLINSGLKEIKENAKDKDLEERACGFTRIAECYKKMEDNENADLYYRQAAKNIREAAGIYEKMSSFILNFRIHYVIRKLKVHFSRSADECDWYIKAASIIKNCRSFISDKIGRHF